LKNTPIRFLVFLGTFSMVAILIVQVFWVSKAISNQEELFNRSVQMALRNVVEQICEINGIESPTTDPIDQLSTNYFIARTNYRIDLESLDELLKSELLKRDINLDYEYGVYDCQTDRMVYGDFVPLQDENKTEPRGELPKLVNDEYYFGIYFPGKTAGLVNSLGIWQISSVLTLIILITFSYALIVILRQKRLSEIQRDFINNMTHEFKTPLATLQVSAEVLESANGERQKKYASIMKEELKRLEKHVHQLLETSALEAEKVQNEHFEPLPILQQLASSFENNLGKNFQSEISLDPSSKLIGDPIIFETIVHNLLDNAFKYGKSEVSFITRNMDKGIEISVSNDGAAIPKKEQKHIFQRFYRINQGDRHDVKGFGLGLYFVKQGVKNMRGKIDLHSDDQVTVFKITLPTA